MFDSTETHTFLHFQSFHTGYSWALCLTEDTASPSSQLSAMESQMAMYQVSTHVKFRIGDVKAQ